MGFDAILDEDLVPLVNDTREACLNWLFRHPEMVDKTLVGRYDHTIIISAQEYISIYAY